MGPKLEVRVERAPQGGFLVQYRLNPSGPWYTWQFYLAQDRAEKLAAVIRRENRLLRY